MSINRMYYGKNKVYSFLESGNSGGGETDCNCEQEYQNGYDQGYSEGYNEGLNNCQGGGNIDGSIFSEIGWSTNDEVSIMGDAINYSKQIYDSWDASTTSTSSMFRDNKDVIFFPKLDMSNVETADIMFYGCENLLYIPDTYTPKLFIVGDMFGGCKSLRKAPKINTEKCEDFYSTFSGCYDLRETPNWDFSNAKSMYSTFRECNSITELVINAPLCISYTQLCAYATIPKIIIDASSCENISEFFGWYGDTNERTTYLLAKNLNTNWDDDNGFFCCPNISYESIKDQIEELANVGGDTKTLKIHPTTMNLLSEADIESAVNKGWIITT